MSRILLCFTLLFLLSCAEPCLCAAEHIILSRAGVRDESMWNAFKRHLTGKGLTVSVYDSPESMEKQVETANRVNREKAAFMLVVELVPSEHSDAFVAVSDARKGKGLIVNADEVPGSHIARSTELGSSIAAQFQRKVKPVSLFMLLGIDMPGVFVRLEVPRGQPAEAFDKLYDGMMNYMKRGNKDERELKGERRNTSP